MSAPGSDVVGYEVASGGNAVLAAHMSQVVKALDRALEAINGDQRRVFANIVQSYVNGPLMEQVCQQLVLLDDVQASEEDTFPASSAAEVTELVEDVGPDSTAGEEPGPFQADFAINGLYRRQELTNMATKYRASLLEDSFKIKVGYGMIDGQLTDTKADAITAFVFGEMLGKCGRRLANLVNTQHHYNNALRDSRHPIYQPIYKSPLLSLRQLAQACASVSRSSETLVTATIVRNLYLMDFAMRCDHILYQMKDFDVEATDAVRAALWASDPTADQTDAAVARSALLEYLNMEPQLYTEYRQDAIVPNAMVAVFGLGALFLIPVGKGNPLSKFRYSLAAEHMIRKLSRVDRFDMIERLCFALAKAVVRRITDGDELCLWSVSQADIDRPLAELVTKATGLELGIFH